MSDSHADRLARARLSLEGLSTGDAIGMKYEIYSAQPLQANRILPPAPWRWTDDTNMALSIFSVLRQAGSIDQDQLARNFADHLEWGRGYGMGARKMIVAVKEGMLWRRANKTVFGEGSFGNGAAMRIAPLGAYFADDMPTLVENARLSSEITHAHPEGIAGGIAVAVAAAVAWQARGTPKPSRAEFISKILPHIPASEVKDGCVKARDLASEQTIEQIVAALGNGQKISAQDTVPLVVYMAGEYLDNYEEAIWNTLSAGGDADTTSAMVGGIVAVYPGEAGIPKAWLEHREPLPAWAFEE
jgi:ADP-ribosylglycohydrolase